MPRGTGSVRHNTDEKERPDYFNNKLSVHLSLLFLSDDVKSYNWSVLAAVGQVCFPKKRETGRFAAHNGLIL